MGGGGAAWGKKINILTFGLSNNVPNAWDFKRLKRLSLSLFFLFPPLHSFLFPSH